MVNESVGLLLGMILCPVLLIVYIATCVWR